MNPASIVLAGQDADIHRILEKAGFGLLFAPSPDAVRHVLRSEAGDLVVIPAEALKRDGKGILASVQAARPQIPIIAMGRVGSDWGDLRLNQIEMPADPDRFLGAVRQTARRAVARRRKGRDGLSHAIEDHLERYFKAHAPGLPAPGMHGWVLREVERPLISLALGATRGNQLKAATLLGLNRNTLRKKIRELDIEVMRGIK